MSRHFARSLVMGLASVVALSACTVSTQQMMDLGTRAVDAIKERGSTPKDLWRMRFAGAEYLLQHEQRANGHSVFFDAAGIQIDFDGRDITSVVGLPGAIGPMTIEINGNERRYLRGGNRNYTVTCNPPIAWRTGPTQGGWRTRCWGSLNGVPVYVQHQTEWASATTLSGISTTLIPGFAPLVLEKTSP